MSLLKILEKNEIGSSPEFKKYIKEQEWTFDKWALFLLGEKETSLSDIVNSLIEITHLKPKEAQAVALLAHFKGRAIITYGTGEGILELAQRFEKAGITVAIADLNDIKKRNNKS